VSRARHVLDGGPELGGSAFRRLRATQKLLLTSYADFDDQRLARHSANRDIGFSVEMDMAGVEPHATVSRHWQHANVTGRTR
jgi:hypothetical protein